MATPFPPFDGSAPPQQQFSDPPEMGIDPSKRYTATMSTSMGEMVIALDPIKAPNTVNSFVFLALHHYFDGIIFHRIINGFVCQGGDPTGTGRGGPGYRFRDELEGPGSYSRGTVAMANAGPNTNGSQFFICHSDAGLPHSYTIFGKVTSGMETVDAIATTATDGSDRPHEDCIINSVSIAEG